MRRIAYPIIERLGGRLAVGKLLRQLQAETAEADPISDGAIRMWHQAGREISPAGMRLLMRLAEQRKIPYTHDDFAQVEVEDDKAA